jgi:UDP-N-acetylmuramate dehydrogenase
MKDALARIAAAVRGEARVDEPLAPRTSLRVGGPADLLVKPVDPADVSTLLAAGAAEGVPVTVLGGGANTLVADAGVEGVVVKLPSLPEEASLDGTGGTFVFSAGTPIARVVQRMREHRLLGAEFLAGIPGTLGGAVVMNAGTPAGETERIVVAVELADGDGVGWVERERLVFRYRCCELPPGAVVTRVRVRLSRGSEAELAESRAAMEADVSRRKRTQPLHLPNCGSVFRNPPGDHAGRLIEAAGLKGLARGGAQISEKHANFIVNGGGATASDVRWLLEHMRATVRERFGVELHPEVKLVGRWDTWKA